MTRVEPVGSDRARRVEPVWSFSESSTREDSSSRAESRVESVGTMRTLLSPRMPIFFLDVFFMRIFFTFSHIVRIEREDVGPTEKGGVVQLGESDWHKFRHTRVENFAI